MAYRLGVSLHDWEYMTPRELLWMVDEWQERNRDEVKISRSKLYTLAALVRAMIWSKHPPKYERVFPEDREKKEMTDDELYAQAKVLNALFGGKEA